VDVRPVADESGDRDRRERHEQVVLACDPVDDEPRQLRLISRRQR
jgi:hypothetical protein